MRWRRRKTIQANRWYGGFAWIPVRAYDLDGSQKVTVWLEPVEWSIGRFGTKTYRTQGSTYGNKGSN